MKAIQFPPFFTPETLRIAISEVDTANLTPDERMVAEITLSNNAIAMWQEIERRDKYVEKEKKECIKRALELGLDIDIIAHLYNVSIDFINEIAAEID